MTRFAKKYQEHRKKKKELNKIEKVLNREGYGYIKRRVGLLSNELKAPTYCSIIDKPESTSHKSSKS